MKFLVYLYASLTLAGNILVAQAQSPPSNTIEKQVTPEGAKTEIVGSASSTKDAVKGTEPSSTPLKQFVPKEKIPADSAIAFPVDI